MGPSPPGCTPPSYVTTSTGSEVKISEVFPRASRMKVESLFETGLESGATSGQGTVGGYRGAESPWRGISPAHRTLLSSTV